MFCSNAGNAILQSLREHREGCSIMAGVKKEKAGQSDNQCGHSDQMNQRWHGGCLVWQKQCTATFLFFSMGNYVSHTVHEEMSHYLILDKLNNNWDKLFHQGLNVLGYLACLKCTGVDLSGKWIYFPVSVETSHTSVDVSIFTLNFWHCVYQPAQAYCLSKLRVEPTSAGPGWEVGYPLDRLPANWHSCTLTWIVYLWLILNHQLT